jgi:filamentous hemagglutinin family protein
MMKKIFKRWTLPLLLAASFGAAVAAPASPQVVAGQATFSQQGNVFSITNTPNTIINWQSFSVNPGEITRFVQQSADSAVLNRILGQDPTKILGALQSNGKVFLINPNGILFGKDSRVDVNGLVASTLDITNADFLAGKKNFSAGPLAGGVDNQGSITTASGGQVFLLAPKVENSGLITSPQGEVVLAAGHSVQLVDSRDPDLHVVVSAPGSQSLNLGQLIAQGGKIGIYGALVNQRGLVSANSAVVGENGKIVFKASRATQLGQGSVTSATGAGVGGAIHVLGDSVAVTGNAQLDASGAAGGGSVLVGGDWQGANPLLPNARQVSFGGGASIRADALQSGDGGKVVLWSNGATSAHGSISARGGALAGNGGRVETSGHHLDVDGIAVNAGASRGRNGSWLLDPENIEVTSGQVNEGVTKIAPSTLNASGTDILLQANRDLTISEAFGTAHSVSGQAGNNISVNAAVTSGGDIDLRAGNSIALGAAGKLRSDNYIDLKANSMTLAGNIEGAGGQLPVVSFTSFDAGRAITVGTANGDGLVLDAEALGKRVTAYEINIGNGSHSGDIRVASALSTTANLVLDNAGRISIDAPVSLTGAGSSFIASLYTAPGSSAEISIGAAGSVGATRSVMLQGDRMAIGGGIAAPAVTLRPHNVKTGILLGTSTGPGALSLTNAMLGRVATSDLTIGGLPGQVTQMRVGEAINLRSGPAKVTLDAGDAQLTIDALLAVRGLLELKSDFAIVEGAGSVEADRLSLQGGQVMMGASNHIASALAAAVDGNVFQFNAGGNLAVGQAGTLAGINAPNAAVRMVVTDGALTINQPISTSQEVVLDAGGIRGSGGIAAAMADLTSSAGIGTGTQPLPTQVHFLSATNRGQGSNPINIVNQGDLVLLKAVQDGAGNGGAITVENFGGMRVPGHYGEESGGVVRTSSGNIALSTHSPLTIEGNVTTDTGSINLTAGNDGALTISAGARVASTSGEVTLVGGSTEFAPGTVQVSSPDKLHLPSSEPPPAPSLDSCLANGGQAGCDAVLSAAIQACVADPDGANCARVLPTLESCQITPSAQGCGVVLARAALLACIADPKGQGCDKVLPAWEVCEKSPSTLGCVPVIAARQALDACVANPKGPGCDTILPAWETCHANSSVYGCAPVLAARQALDACVANPKGPGCDAILPTWEACHTNSSIYGCAPVIAARQALDVCVANPKGPGCDTILPSWEACHTNSSTYGCAPVLAARQALDACIANPKGPGCEAILPAWEACHTNSSTYGCAPVLAARQALDACIANPQGPLCDTILPAWEACRANSSIYGCAPVLAARQALDACIANPKGPGCGAILPTWDTCSKNASIYGCVPVIAARQALDACIANPKGPGCDAILPSWESCNANSSIYGCVPVIAARQALLACIATPTAGGCADILPKLAACRADGTILGCAPVLARAQFEVCLANPTGPGCTAVLPSLPSCKVNRAQEGCSQVLDLAWNFCLAHPNDASCSGILPTLGQCVANQTSAGCEVVLPTLAQCIGSPTLQGCQVVLPKLEQCAVSPNIAGCEAVLPKPDFCATHPLDPTCQVFNPAPGSNGGADKKEVAQAVQTTVTLINNSTESLDRSDTASGGGSAGPDKGAEKSAGPAASENSGAKNEKPATKTYCN